jgi:ribosomal-protein-alanine N-acetyltransferase
MGTATPFLTGPRVYLRAVVDADLDGDYLGWLNDAEVTRFLETGRYPVTRETLERYVARFRGSADDVLFAIVERGSEAHIGNVTLNHINWIRRSADTGILIGRKDLWGKGYGFEAWSLAIAYAFTRLGLRRITAGAVDLNGGSIAALKKLGFIHEGTLRQHALVDGEYRDSLMFGLLREEFSPVSSDVSSQASMTSGGEGLGDIAQREAKG